MFLSGLIAILIGVSILGFFGVRKCYRLYQKQMLMKNNPVVEIADLNIKAPILEGTDNETLAKAAGHFKDSGDFGKGNYCIAGHSSTLYKEYFGSFANVGVVKSICKQVQTAAYQGSNHGISATGGFTSHGYSCRNRVSFVN